VTVRALAITLVASGNDGRTPNRRPLVHRLDGVVPLARG